MAASISVLGESHLDALVRFLESRRDASLLMRAALRTHGLRDEGRPGQATYVGLLHDGEVRAVVSHLVNGRLLFQAPEQGPALAASAQRATGRPVTGMFAPWAQLEEARHALGLVHAPTGMLSHEDLLALDLEALAPPLLLRTGEVRCRRARDDEREPLAQMRFDFWVDGMKEQPSPALRRAAEEVVRVSIAEGTLFVLETADGVAVSTCTFTAVLPEEVQVGGVWTPSAFRGRGYAGAVVAGALDVARAEGKRRAVLFTGKVNQPAQVVYRRLGFERVGDYGIALFHEGQTLRI